MLVVRTEDNKTFKQIQTPAFEDRVLADGGEVTTLDNTDKLLDGVVALNPSLVMVPSGYKASKLHSQVPYSGLGDMTVTRSGDTGMRLNNGYWQPVAANVPRVDLTWNEATQMFEQWLQVEELRTNLLPRYKTFPHSDWTKSGARIEGDPTTAGAELITNSADREFTSDTGYWNKTLDWTISDGKANANGNGNIRRADILTSGKLYKVTFDVIAVSGDLVVYFRGNNIRSINTSGTYTLYGIAGTTSTFLDFYAAPFVGSIDNISVKEVTGYASPFVDSAGVNLMDGYKLVEDTSNGIHQTYRASITKVANQVLSFSIFAKKAERDWLVLDFFEVGVGDKLINYNLNTGTIGTVASGVTANITSYVNGWYKCEVTITTGATTAISMGFLIATTNNGYSYLGDGTSGILIAHAQLEAGATASSPIGGAEGSAQSRNADVISADIVTSFDNMLTAGISIFAEIPNWSKSQNTESQVIGVGVNSFNVGEVGFGLSYTNSTSKLTLEMLGDNGGRQRVSSTNTFTENQYLKILFSYNAITKKILLYVNGVKQIDNTINDPVTITSGVKKIHLYGLTGWGANKRYKLIFVKSGVLTDAESIVLTTL